MRKRNTEDLTTEDRRKIKLWLKLPSVGKKCSCPFVRGCEICRAIFPTFSRREASTAGGRCPCSVFQIDHVIKVARSIIK